MKGVKENIKIQLETVLLRGLKHLKVWLFPSKKILCLIESRSEDI